MLFDIQKIFGAWEKEDNTPMFNVTKENSDIFLKLKVGDKTGRHKVNCGDHGRSKRKNS